MSTPPSRGPTTDEIPTAVAMKPPYTDRLWSGTDCATITTAPENIPADPIPAIARPIIKVVEVGAAPQRADPASKMTVADTNTHLGE